MFEIMTSKCLYMQFSAKHGSKLFSFKCTGFALVPRWSSSHGWEERWLGLQLKRIWINKAPTGLLYAHKRAATMVEILETVFKKETIGLVTREWVNIRNKIEEEEKEKLQKIAARGGRTSDAKMETEEEENHYKMKFVSGKRGKDPTVESSFLPVRCVEFTLMLPEENHYKKKFASGKLGKDPTVVPSFLLNSYSRNPTRKPKKGSHHVEEEATQ
ncbi:Protein XAP5 CIRCADIAN [Musa troglodytarum]|uniref:Protein XAP5 CIRCADIAN n=1 Tax=Musa troglodytarum TaxID=320322 RepID=A0A9E7JCZ4_9LILI|nr:Protein XAP5 CIRCADIAN [Musa troglodytarum]